MTDSADSPRPSPALDALEADFLARLSLVRRTVKERTSPIELALERYRRALEEEGARKLSLNHSLARVSDLKLASDRAAELLFSAVKEILPGVDTSLLDSSPTGSTRSTDTDDEEKLSSIMPRFRVLNIPSRQALYNTQHATIGRWRGLLPKPTRQTLQPDHC